ncbi:MAG: CHASE2 domain-containing protein [Elusimicrobia bacterium]|nr:CHASE2 domain-containing protein [Elusimicrobiota bacterium]MBD3412685.1 CHASE2 domain-containing protein [Elusimicrobiota bacterium]
MKEKRFRLISILIGIFISVIITGLFAFGVWDTLEHKALDFRFIMRGEIPVSGENDPEKVVIIGIDEPSVEQYGRWPWPRDLHAKLINTLTEAGADVIVFDVILSEEDAMNPAGDWKLMLATEASERVIHCSFFEARKMIIADQGLQTKVINHQPFGTLKDASWDVGFVNAYPDADGGLRHCALSIDHEGKRYFPITVLAAAHYLKTEPEEILKLIPDNAIYKARDFDTTIKRTMMMANYYGPEDSISSYSYHQILNDHIPIIFKQNWVKDKIVIVGSKVIGAFDHYPMAFQKVYPGVEFHATVVNNILGKSFIQKIPPLYILLFIIIGGLFSGITIPRLSPWLGTVAVFILAGAYIFGTQWMFVEKMLYIELVPPLAAMLVSYVTILFYRFVMEEKEKRRIKRTFGQYVSRTVLDEILSNPNLAKLGGERRMMSILFSDIRGFTSMSEGMDHEAVVDILNEYLTRMTDMVYKHGGTLDKFIGDAVMAFWGAPTPQPDHAQRAVLCAIDMIDELHVLQEKWRSEGRHVIDIGVGINTGDAVVGNMGSHERMDYTVIGDNVNLASRLEGLNKQYKSNIIISAATYELVKDMIEVKDLGKSIVKGKEIEISIFQVLGRKQKTEDKKAA